MRLLIKLTGAGCCGAQPSGSAFEGLVRPAIRYGHCSGMLMKTLWQSYRVRLLHDKVIAPGAATTSTHGRRRAEMFACRRALIRNDRRNRTRTFSSNPPLSAGWFSLQAMAEAEALLKHPTRPHQRHG